nr:MAG TPA: antitoxin [Caudoviricetes sp.]DAP79811.1 MAG TPA: antitoxin [Caudoviricetes sp.]
MIKTNDLRGEIAKNGYSQAEMAKKIGITPKTFYEKMAKGVFGSDEIEIMIKELKLEDPMAIFFATE